MHLMWQLYKYIYIFYINININIYIYFLTYVWASLVTQPGKNLPTMQGDPSSIPGSGRSPGEGNGNPLQHSRLKYPMDRRAQWATAHGVAESRTQLSN